MTKANSEGKEATPQRARRSPCTRVGLHSFLASSSRPFCLDRGNASAMADGESSEVVLKGAGLYRPPAGSWADCQLKFYKDGTLTVEINSAVVERLELHNCSPPPRPSPTALVPAFSCPPVGPNTLFLFKNIFRAVSGLLCAVASPPFPIPHPPLSLAPRPSLLMNRLLNLEFGIYRYFSLA